ncbi:MAG: hypothetical protein KJ990_12755 [Proteobacteria bacterium]|nr:hypothetical protein [Pseudomonadota bacterium]MBU1649722.1 hypothetical protein [Pseudomonadota bacterium]
MFPAPNDKNRSAPKFSYLLLAAVSDQKVRIAFGNATKAARKDAIWTNEHISGIVNEKREKSLTTALG